MTTFARAAIAFRSVEFAAAYQIASAEFFENRGIGRCVRLEALLVFHIDVPNPITLGHRQSPFVFDYDSAKLPPELPPTDSFGTGGSPGPLVMGALQAR